jgi:serine/threonine-protein kinase
MSPEQFGERDIDLRTDVWSLGLIAYRCLSGVLPTQGNNVFEVFRKIVDRPMTPLEEVAPALPADVTRLVDRMLARKREERPLDLREVIEVFARYADGRASPRAEDPGRIVPAGGAAGEAAADEYATTHLLSKELKAPPPITQSETPVTSMASTPKARGSVARSVGVVLGVGAAASAVAWRVGTVPPAPAAAPPTLVASVYANEPVLPSPRAAPSVAPSAPPQPAAPPRELRTAPPPAIRRAKVPTPTVDAGTVTPATTAGGSEKQDIFPSNPY